MILGLILAAVLTMQAPGAPLPLLLEPGSSHFGTSGHWVVIRTSSSCMTFVAYATRADGGRRALSIAWLPDEPARRLMLTMNDTSWPALFAARRGDYRLEYVGARPARNPPPVMPARVTTRTSRGSVSLSILFDEAAAPAAVENLSRSIGFEVYRGRRRISADRLDGAAGVMRLLTQCAATLRTRGGETPLRP
jgi:hypothetical protein